MVMTKVMSNEESKRNSYLLFSSPTLIREDKLVHYSSLVAEYVVKMYSKTYLAPLKIFKKEPFWGVRGGFGGGVEAYSTPPKDRYRAPLQRVGRYLSLEGGVLKKSRSPGFFPFTIIFTCSTRVTI